MALESFEYFDDLVEANPEEDDLVSQGDNHLRGIKETVLNHLDGNAVQTRLKVGKAVRLRAVDTALEWWASSDVAGTVSALRLTNADGSTVLGRFQVDRDQEVRLSSLGASVPLRLQAGSDLGVAQTLVELVGGPLGYTALRYNGVETVRVSDRLVTTTGLRQVVQALTGEVPRYELSNADHGLSLELNNNGIMRLRTRLGDLSTPQTSFEGIRDGESRMYNAGILAVNTTVNGVQVRRSAPQTTTLLSFRDDLSNVEGSLRFQATQIEMRAEAGRSLRLAVNGGATLALSISSAGVWDIRHQGTSVASSNAEGLGMAQLALTDAAPTDPGHAARKDYVDDRTAVASGTDFARADIGDEGGGSGALHMECGRITTVGTTGSVTFNTAFLTRPVVLIAQADGDTTTTANVQVRNITPSGFTWDALGAQSDRHWIAIGQKA